MTKDQFKQAFDAIIVVLKEHDVMIYCGDDGEGLLIAEGYERPDIQIFPLEPLAGFFPNYL